MPFVKYIGQNDAIAQLEGAINASATTIVLKAWHGARLASTFPFLATLRNYDTDGSVLKREIVKVTARTDDTLTVVRSFEPCRISDTAWAPSSVASTFSTDDYISMDVTAWLIDDIQDEVTRIVAVDLPLKLNKATYDAERTLFWASSIGTDAYKITSSDVTTYVNGQTFKIQADVANTGACTLELNSLGAKAIEKLSSGAFVALATGDIVVNQIFWATYNSVEDCFQFSVDPATTSVATPSATTTSEGIAELIIESEMETGTDSSRIVTANFIPRKLFPNSLPTSATYHSDIIFPAVGASTNIITNGWSESNATLAVDQWWAGIIFFDTGGGVDASIMSLLPGIWSNAYFRFADIGANALYFKTRIKFGTSPSATEALSWWLWEGGNAFYALEDDASIQSIRFCLADNTGDKLYAVTSNGTNYRATNITWALTLTNHLNIAMIITSTNVYFYAGNGNAMTLVATHTSASDYIPTSTNNIYIWWGINESGSQPDMYIQPIHLSLPTS